MALESKQYEACLSLLDPLKHNQLKKKEYFKLVNYINLITIIKCSEVDYKRKKTLHICQFGQ